MFFLMGNEFMELSLEDLLDYIEDNRLNVESEDPVFSACISWVKYDEPNRKKDLNYIIDSIRLEYCSQDFLKDITREHSALLDTLKIQKHLVEALLQTEQSQVIGISPHVCRTGYKLDLPKLVILGGCMTNVSNVKSFNRSCWALTNEQKWRKFSTMQNDYGGSRFCRVPNGLVMTGGGQQTSQGPKPVNIARLYCEHFHAWTDLPHMNKARMLHGMLCWMDTIYVFAGFSDGAATDTVECLKVGEKKWKYVTPLIRQFLVPLTAVVESYLYLIVNTNTTAIRNAVRGHGVFMQCYDVRNDSWSVKAPMPAAVESTEEATAVGTKDSIFVVGGDKKLCSQYNVRYDVWTILKPCSTLHNQGAVILYQSKILVLGGHSDVVEEYDIKRDEWQLLPWKLPANLHFHFACFMKVKD